MITQIALLYQWVLHHVHCLWSQNRYGRLVIHVYFKLILVLIEHTLDFYMYLHVHEARTIPLLAKGNLQCFWWILVVLYYNNVFKFNAEPPIVVNVTLMLLSNAHKNADFTVAWSQSNCAVQYVVTIINSSNNRVYPNITTSNTNTTVTLPTGVEFCVTLVAVDSIGRRGPDTTPVCYQCEW